MLTVVCAHCGAYFQSQRSTAKFCSNRCRIGAHRGASRPMGSTWLRRAAVEIEKNILRPAGAGINAGSFDVSFGFPARMQRASYAGGKMSFIGGVTLGTKAIVIPPQANPLRIMEILVHEMIHIAAPGDGHGKVFQRISKAVGLLPPYTATTASPELNEKLKDIVLCLGPMPTPFDSIPSAVRGWIELPDGSFVANELPEEWAPPRHS